MQFRPAAAVFATLRQITLLEYPQTRKWTRGPIANFCANGPRTTLSLIGCHENSK